MVIVLQVLIQIDRIVTVEIRQRVVFLVKVPHFGVGAVVFEHLVIVKLGRHAAEVDYLMRRAVTDVEVSKAVGIVRGGCDVVGEGHAVGLKRRRVDRIAVKDVRHTVFVEEILHFDGVRKTVIPFAVEAVDLRLFFYLVAEVHLLVDDGFLFFIGGCAEQHQRQQHDQCKRRDGKNEGVEQVGCHAAEGVNSGLVTVDLAGGIVCLFFHHFLCRGGTPFASVGCVRRLWW